MKILLAVACLLLPSVALAQTYTTASVMKWNAPTNAMDAADAASFTYRAYVNGATTGVAVLGVTCGPAVAPDTVFSCSAAIPSSLLAGLNRRRSTVYITGEDTTTPVSGESDPSNTFVVNRRPNASTTLRNQQ